jgi:dienelactone hydrolase
VRILILFISGWTALFFAQPVAHGTSTPEITITPDRAFFGDTVKIALQGFEKNQLVTVSAVSTNSAGQIWESHAEFRTDWHGRVNLAAQAPVSGTYRRADAMGLFWSMSRVPGKKATNKSTDNAATNVDFVQITAKVNEQVLAAATFHGCRLAPGVERIPVHDHGLRGVLYLPPGKKPHPGVIVLGGSEGGIGMIEFDAAYLASKGYAALALGYFRYEGLPESLENIRLEYFETAINWLEARKDVRHDGVAVLGHSRGAELALKLGATFSQIRAVVAFSPSSVIWGGIGSGSARQSAWIYHGRALPFMNGKLTSEQRKEMDLINWTNSMAGTRWCEIQLENKTAVDNAAIPVEKINGPVLLISGNEDQLWPSTEMSDMVMDRLKENNHPFPDERLSYPNVGHFIPLPHSPDLVPGGDVESTAAAGVDSWGHMIKFLNAGFRHKR